MKSCVHWQWNALAEFNQVIDVADNVRKHYVTMTEITLTTFPFQPSIIRTWTFSGLDVQIPKSKPGRYKTSSCFPHYGIVVVLALWQIAVGVVFFSTGPQVNAACEDTDTHTRSSFIWTSFLSLPLSLYSSSLTHSSTKSVQLCQSTFRHEQTQSSSDKYSTLPRTKQVIGSEVHAEWCEGMREHKSAPKCWILPSSRCASPEKKKSLDFHQSLILHIKISRSF